MNGARISSCFGYLPLNVLFNSDLCSEIDTSDEWIVSRTGIRQRHIAASDEMTSDMALNAARGALARSNLSSVDMIIVATTTPDNTFPSTAVKVQSGLNLSLIPAFDIQAVCSGFLYGLEVANSFINSGKYKTILLIGADKMSKIVNWNDRSTCVLFGDGAGAVVLQPGNEVSGLIDMQIYAEGAFYNFLHTSGGASSGDLVGKVLMDGRVVFRHAVVKMASAIESLIQKNNVKKSQIKYFIPHQANQRITEALRKELDLHEDQVISTVHSHANCSAGSIPLALDYALELGKIEKGDIILFAAFGGGFTWGAALIRW